MQFNCEAKAQPGNVTVKWFREGAPVKELASLETRVTIKRDGSLVINPVSSEDSGQYLCEVSNGIGEPQSASAYLNVECKFNVILKTVFYYVDTNISFEYILETIFWNLFGIYLFITKNRTCEKKEIRVV